MLGMPNRNHLKYLGVAGAAFVLIGVTYWPAQGQIRELEAEKQYWQGQQDRNPLKTQGAQLPHLLELPSIIEQCQGLFQERQVQVLSINLERLGEDSAESTGSTGSEQTVSMSYALLHFKLQGSWDGIEAGLKQIETIPDQAIQLQEVRLNTKGGEIVMKIYFYEPDKPSLP